MVEHWLKRTNFGVIEQIPWQGQTYLSDVPHPQSSPKPEDGASSFTMTSADSLSLILRRLDEIERKLDRMMEELHHQQ